MKILKRLKMFQSSLKKKRKRDYENMISKRVNNKKIEIKRKTHDTLEN